MTAAERIGIAAPVLSDSETEYVLECLRTNWISSKGHFITDFEKEFAGRVGAKHGIAVSSGTTALHLALAALGVGPGDEVIVPTYTMIACANAVRYCGARPVLADSDPETGNLDPADLARRVTPRTKAAMPVHLYGHPAEMEAIRAITEPQGIALVEDAAQAHGALYHGKPAGSMSAFGAFSFYANKIVTCGEGGMVVTSDDRLAENARSLRDQGYDPARRKFLVHDRIGFNYRLTNLQAAVGLAQTQRMDEFVRHHRENAALYNELLASVPGIRRPPERPGIRNVYWMYTIQVDAETYGRSRDELLLALEKEGIETRSSFVPIHLQPAYAGQYEGEKFPVAEKLGREGLNLPSGNNTTPDEVRRVAAAIARLRGG
jgi:perosamine synthetase